MTKTIRIEYYGMEGAGATVKEAKADASRKIERALHAAREPMQIVTVFDTGLAAMVGYDVRQDSYGYRVLNWDSKFQVGPQWLNVGYVDMPAARAAALKHMIECTWNPAQDDEQRIDDVLASESGARIRHGDRAEFKREYLKWCGWQRLYKAFRDQGMTDGEAHAATCGYRLVHAADTNSTV